MTTKKPLRTIEPATTAELLEALVPNALEALHQVLTNSAAPAAARVAAAKEILDRTQGRPGFAAEPAAPPVDILEQDMTAARASSEYMRLRSTFMHLPDDELPEHVQRALAGLQAQIDAGKK